jgi:hypothetical protein
MAGKMDPDKLRSKLTKLFAMLGSANQHESETARRLIHDLLARNKKTWNDLLELLQSGNTAGWRDDEDPPSAAPTDEPGKPAPLDLIARLLEMFLHLSEAQRVGLTLWIVHTFCFSRFSITPRLALLSPVRGCGKTTALAVIEALAFNTRKSDSITAAALYRIIDCARACMLLDEIDNADLRSNGILRAVINSGHRAGGGTTRVINDEPKTFTTFAPLAIAAIGNLPLPVSHRSIAIRMERSPDTELERFDPRTNEAQHRMCTAVYFETLSWMQQAKLEPNPPMPKELRNRAADNWRVLFAIADACSPEWGQAARNAALELSQWQDEDIAVQLLSDIREIFKQSGLDRISSSELVASLLEREDSQWLEWCGPHGNRPPRKLTMAALARVLSVFGIRPRTIWQPRPGVREKTIKGYLRSSFERAWASYCPEREPSGTTNIRHLRAR